MNRILYQRRLCTQKEDTAPAWPLVGFSGHGEGDHALKSCWVEGGLLPALA